MHLLPLLRARLDCLTKPCDIIHMIVFHQKVSQMELSGVYTVCLKISLLWETNIVYTTCKLENNFKKFSIILTMCRMNTMDTIQTTLMAV